MPLVTPGLESIDKVTVQMVVAPHDTLCSAAQAERVKNEIGGGVKRYTTIEGTNIGHSYFGVNNDPTWLANIVDQIEW